ncbi:hypothetical protein Pla108_31990 [Botrimarina colliarenosi]|uniref:Uncharacterized protein n=1 Tax=Botrimarina colliarenosi TaxID=2528001 RepID=A0A5C6A9T6_9BACT|nr:hypothetical protein Pla108_31990 [Botrimarina colliarenosi]
MAALFGKTGRPCPASQFVSKPTVEGAAQRPIHDDLRIANYSPIATRYSCRLPPSVFP